MKAVIVNANDQSLSIGEVNEPTVSSGEIQIKVRAIGVNRADTLQRKGLYPPPEGESEILGLEVAGEVCHIGEGCKRFKLGDRVFALLAGGGYAEYVCVDERLAMSIPENLSFEEAAGVAEVFLTAYQALFQLAELLADETVLIHAGASGVGTAAIQLAKFINARVVITAGTDEKIRFCKKLGADIGINYKTSSNFDEMILKQCIDGVEVVIDFVGASYFDRNVSVLKLDGRWVILAFLGGRVAKNLNLGGILMKRIKIMGSTLRARTTEYKAQLIKEFDKEFMTHFAGGELKPIIDKVFSWMEVEKAHEYMETNQNIGKIILKI